MKVVFWGGSHRCGTTSSMTAVASYLSLHSSQRSICVQPKEGGTDLELFFRPWEARAMLHEESTYYALEGMDYLIWQEQHHRLDEATIRETLVPVLDGRLSYLPSGAREKPGLYPQQTGELQRRILAQLEADHPTHTAVCLLTDKEEIGSMGATGMQSRYFENVVAEVLNLTGQYSDLALRRCLQHSHMLSSDVSAAFDPNYASAFEKKNIAYLGRGMVFNKYTGSRGKSGSNDASAEYIGALRKVMDDSNVCWQTAELGKVDQGGGGTIAYITANYGMDVIDSGVALLSMHSPWEISSKADIYEAYKGYKAFQKADWER